jgi:hypothetical protein
MSVEYTVYDNDRTGTAQIFYVYNATAGHLKMPDQDYIHGSRPAGHVVWTPSAQVNFEEAMTVWSSSSDSFTMCSTISLSEAGHDTVTFAGQEPKYSARYGMSAWIHTSGYTLTGKDSETDLDRFQRDERFFLSMIDELVKSEMYHDKFVAVLDGRIIDFDSDEAVLAERCYREHGYTPIYIDKVERIKRIINLPSPQRVR